MSLADDLRRQAARCRRLAQAINHPDAIAQLEAMAAGLEQRAAELEREAPEDGKP